MTLEERIAEALCDADNAPEPEKVNDYWQGLARAVVAVLPTADVSDEAIVDALYPHVLQYTDDAAYCAGDCEWVAERFGSGTARGQWAAHVAAVVRAPFDAQAAAHAAEVERLHNVYDAALFTAHTAGVAEVERLRAEVERLTESLDYANKGKAELEAEVEALRADRDKLVDQGFWAGVKSVTEQAEAIRDRAVREALENAARQIEAACPSGAAYDDASFYRQEGRVDANEDAAEIVRSLIPGGTDD